MEEWKEYKLEEVCKSIADGDHMPPPKSSKGIPFVTISNIVDNRLDFSNTHFVPRSYYDGLDDKRRPHVGDTIYSVVGTFGKPLYIKEEKPFVFQRHIAILRPDESKIVPQFLFYSLLSPQFYRKADVMAIGAVQRTISLTSLRNATIQLPPLEIQSKIVDMLSSLDDKIEVNRQINDNLEHQAQALFKSWFVDFEPFRDGEFVESVLGMIPKGWRVGTLFDVAEIFDKQRKPLSGKERENMQRLYPYYGATSCMDYVDNYLFDGIYTLIGEDGSVAREDGLPYMQYVWGKFWVNNHAHILQGKNGFSTEMIHVFLSITNIQHLVTGAVQAKLSQANMQKILLAIPPVNVLNQIRPIIGSMYETRREKEDESRSLATLRDTLLPRLMSGEIKVGDVTL